MNHSQFAKELRTIARRANSSGSREITDTSKAYLDAKDFLYNIKPAQSTKTKPPYKEKTIDFIYNGDTIKFPARALQAIKDGKFIDAIKIYRSWSNKGLRESKEVCDKIRDSMKGG
jgi:ribosomal protein L7/L12